MDSVLQSILYDLDDELELCWTFLCGVQRAYYDKHGKYFAGTVLENGTGESVDNLWLSFVAYGGGWSLVVRIQACGGLWERHVDCGVDPSRNRKWLEGVK